MMSLTVKVLKEMAKGLEVKGYNKMNKEALVKAIEDAKQPLVEKDSNTVIFEKYGIISTAAGTVFVDEEKKETYTIVDGILHEEVDSITGGPRIMIMVEEAGKQYLCDYNYISNLKEIKEEVEMSKVTVIEDGELGSDVKVVVDDIPTPINQGKPMTVSDALMEALKHPAGTVIEVGTKEEVEAVKTNNKEEVEMNKEELVKEEVKEVVSLVKAENIGAADEKGFAVVKNTYVQAVNTGACFGVIGVEPNGLFKLVNARGTNSWLREDILNRADRYRAVTKAICDKVMAEANKGVQSPAPKKNDTTVKTNNSTSAPKADAVAEIVEKAKKAGEYAKSKFEFRVEQVNNFRQMVLINNKTGEQVQVGVGATVAGKVMELEFQASNGVKVTRESNKVAEKKAAYNPKVKYSDCHCAKCIEEGIAKDKARITEAEKKYLLDNQKYLPENLKNVPLCYKHQATTGARRAIIQGRHGDNSTAHTQLDNNTKTLLR